MNVLENPCLKCTKDWNAGRNCDCTTSCDKLKSYSVAMAVDTKGTFCAKLENRIGICINKYIDEEGSDEKAIEGIRFAFNFIMNEFGG